jgi:hypothetical protein
MSSSLKPSATTVYNINLCFARDFESEPHTGLYLFALFRQCSGTAFAVYCVACAAQHRHDQQFQTSNERRTTSWHIALRLPEAETDRQLVGDAHAAANVDDKHHHATFGSC